jgi:hypothetical protein
MSDQPRHLGLRYLLIMFRAWIQLLSILSVQDLNGIKDIHSTRSISSTHNAYYPFIPIISYRIPIIYNRFNYVVPISEKT